MNEDRRKAPVPQAKFARRKEDFHPIDFSDMATVPMDLYPAFEVEKLPTPETRELVGVTYEEVVAAIESIAKSGAA